jgi:hypothetical protein
MTGGLSPISSSWRQAPRGSRAAFYFPTEPLRLQPLFNVVSDERMGLSFTNYCWSSSAQFFSGQIPEELMTIFYCLRFEIPPTCRTRFPFYYPPGTGWPGYTPRHCFPFSSPPTTRRLPSLKVRLKVRVTLWLAVYRQSARLGVKRLETHDQNFFQLNPSRNCPYVTSSLMRRWVYLLLICLAIRQVYYEFKVKVMLRPTVSLPISLGVKHPIWDLRPDVFCLTVAGILMWGTLSDERTDLSFTTYNVQYIYIFMLLHECIYTIYTRLLSVQAQYSRSCSIFSSFRLWIVVCLEINSSIFAFMFISTGTFLLSCCLAMNYSGFQASCHNIFALGT